MVARRAKGKTAPIPRIAALRIAKRGPSCHSGFELVKHRHAADVLQRLRRAVGLHRQGKIADAEAIYRAVLSRNPVQPDALHFLGLLEQQHGRREEAIRLIRRATEVAPHYADAFNNLGNVLKVNGDLEQAETCYRKALALRPHDANALSNLGAVLRAKGDLDAGEAACRSAIESDPSHIEAYNNLGNILSKQQRHDEAIACYRASIALDPYHPDGPKLLGIALCAAGKPEEAKVVYRKWLDREPKNPVAAHLLAACSGEQVPARASDEYVKNLFDGLAGEFDRHLSHLAYRAPELVMSAVARELPDACGSLEVLDAGCGTGLCARWLRPYARTLSGVDLSAGMLTYATHLALYDKLMEEELTAHLQARCAAYDLIICADTLCYFGSLDIVFAGARGALRARGWFVFTVEQATDDLTPVGYRLSPHGRYCHAHDYVLDTLTKTGFRIATAETATLRNEGGVPVAGLVVTAQACDQTASD